MPGMRKLYLKIFPTILNYQMRHPFFSKKGKTLVENYRTVIFVPTVSKISERIMQNKISDHLENFSLHFHVDTEKDSV